MSRRVSEDHAAASNYCVDPTFLRAVSEQFRNSSEQF